MATHRDIANAILNAQEIRESSYVKSDDRLCVGRYEKTWDQACNEACASKPEILLIVDVCCRTGYCEIWEWAEDYKTRS